MAKRGQNPLESTREKKEKEPKEILIRLIDIYNEWQLDFDKVINNCRKSGKKGKENGQKGKEKYGQKERRFLQFVARLFEMKWDGNAFSAGGQQEDDNDAMIAAYRTMPQTLFMGNYQQGNECAICLGQIYQETIVRPLPCKHIFHNDCIENWFGGNHKTCPSCHHEMATQNVLDQNNNGTANDQIDG
ncbi:hypothetical protein niasHT_028283 [Heterodera trifolii]|uniref:RING-type domain-containing protein n=1 Tax=Heterodera trifolii TaxID=157864 RepID=A0ABD2JUS9_9BILA